MSFPVLPFGRRAMIDLFGRRGTAERPDAHLMAAASWLARAQDMGVNGGVSYGYSLRGGWRAPYRETSGYIAPTFFDLAKEFGLEEWHR
jgi:hypothetical protein